MSEQNSTDTRVEDVMKNILRGETLKNALDFIAFMRASGFTTDDEYGNNFYYMGEPGNVLLCWNNEKYPEGEWGIFNSPIREYGGLPLDESLKEFSRANVRICTGECGCPTWPRGGNQTVFGKEYQHLCSSVIVFMVPDAEALEKIKKLVEYMKLIITEEVNKTEAFLSALAESEWPSVKDIGAHTGRPLGKTYTTSLAVEFTVTPRLTNMRFFTQNHNKESAIVFSGGGWVPAMWQQCPGAIRFGNNFSVECFKGPAEGWTAVEPLTYQANGKLAVDVKINVAANTYSTTVWTLDATGGKDKPHRITIDFPFCLGTGNPATPAITAIDTIYLGPGDGKAAYVIRDFKVVGGE